jgi:16S rRNA G966 N2-methylase RsmD
MIEAEWWDYDDMDELAEAVAGDVGFIIESALDARGQALIALPGGNTPLPIYEKLAAAPIKWKHVTIIPTDDRLVAVDNPLSNVANLARAFMPKGARVLDVCSYVGAWGLSALHHGAASATCVDSSQAALDWVQRNAAANGLTVTTHRGDAFAALDQLRAAGERFDVVIVDPPAFIKRRKDQKTGEHAYQKLNREAMALLADEAIFVSASCSMHLPEAGLLEIVQHAAAQAGRTLQVLEFLGQGPDHPVQAAIPETRYLKTIVARVMR